MAVIDEYIWPQPSITKRLSADPKDRIGFSKFITDGKVIHKDVIKKIYADINKRYGTKYEPPVK